MKKIIFLIISLLIIPSCVFAYSEKIIIGGKTIGIKVDSKGVMVIGFYKVNGKFNKGSPNMQNGDYIVKVEDTMINSVDELTKAIEKNSKNDSVNITYIRNGIEKNTSLKLINIDGVIKTGLFVKSSIMGIGTLSYIDPETKIFGALGHEIIESASNSIVEIKSGQIFNNKITGIEKSKIGVPGSKMAKFDYNQNYGSIFKNTKYGIFGYYNDTLENFSLANIGEAKVGSAEIKTVLSDENIETFNIEITSVNDNSEVKNISFKINDDRLLELTGGVVQGMSGSPILQNGNIVGVLTHVIVDNPYTGYGLYIRKMLEEGEK